MKRINKPFIVVVVVTFIVLLWGEQVQLIPTDVITAIGLPYFAFIFFHILIYPKILRARMRRLQKRMPERTVLFKSGFFVEEFYLLDLDHGVLMMLNLLNPFRIQKIDLAKVDDVEIVKKIFNNTVVASVRCRLHMGSKKHDIWIDRDARYARQ